MQNYRLVNEISITVITDHNLLRYYMTNGKVERINGIIGSMLGKLLLGKPTDLWDLYLDQALFACRVRTNATTKASPFYLVYGRQPHWLGDVHKAHQNDETTERNEKRINSLQSDRTET